MMTLSLAGAVLQTHRQMDKQQTCRRANIQEDKLADRQTGRSKDGQTQRGRYTCRGTNRQAYGQADRQRGGRQQADRHRERHTDRQPEGHTTGKGTNNQTYRQVDIQKDYKQTGRQTIRQLTIAQRVCSYGAHRVWNKENSTLFMDKLHTFVEE